MKKLSEKEWKPKKLTDDFRPVRGRESNMAMLELGNVPLISAKNGSNGVKGFVNTPKKLVDGGCITLNNDGDGGAGLAYYQSAEMALDTHVTALIPRTDMKPAAMLFASECISELHGFFGHGLSISNKRVKNIKVMFPVTDSGEPDYDYMAEYTKQMREKLLAKYREYAEKRIAELGEEVVIPALDEKTWKSFRAGDLFDIYTGGDMIVSRLAYGNIPLISHSEQNNGVVKYIKKQQDIKLFDCNKTLSLADRGNFCANIQSKNFYVGTRVKALVFKNKIKNPRNILKFISICINKQSVKFNYGNNCTGSVASLLIMLPVTDDGNPDYEYMEQYAKNVMHRKYKQYMTFLEKKSQSK